MSRVPTKITRSTTASVGAGSTNTRSTAVGGTASTTTSRKKQGAGGTAAIDDELAALRQKMAIPLPTSLAIALENKRNPEGISNIPANRRVAPSSAPSRDQRDQEAARNTAAVDAWVSNQHEVQHGIPAGSRGATSTAAVALAKAPTQQQLLPTTSTSVSSLLFAGTFQKDTLSTINSRSFPSSSAPEVGDHHIQKHDVLRYVRRQTTEFDEAMSVINDFVYDEDFERRKKGDIPPVHNDPFVFVEVEQSATSNQNANHETPTKGQSTTGSSVAPRKPTSPAPTYGGRGGAAGGPTKTSTTRVGTSASATTATERHGFRGDLYSVDAAMTKSDSVKPAKLKKQSGNTMLTSTSLSQHEKKGTASQQQQQEEAPAARIKQVKYREQNVTMKHVDRGLIRFCQSCSRVILGEGEGNCPHCGAMVYLPRGDGDDDGRDIEVADTAVGDDGCETSSTRKLLEQLADEEATRGMTIEEIEAEEARKFREAVASWRGNDESAGKEKEEKEAAARRLAEQERMYRAQQRDEHMRIVAGGKRFQYFQHLWGEMQAVLESNAPPQQQ